MSPEEIKSLLTAIGAVIAASTAIFMVLYKGKELKTLHENNLEKRFKSSLEYDEKFFRKNDHQYSKIVKDNAARDAVGNKNVDYFLVELLFLFHEYKLAESDEMIFLFESGVKNGYLKYNRTENLKNCFEFRFRKNNSQIYLGNELKVKKIKKTEKKTFVILFWVLMVLSIFFAYMMSVSTTVLDFIFPLFFLIVSFPTGFLYLNLNFAMDNTEQFLEKFYKAEQEYRILKNEEEKKLLDSQRNSEISNYSEYTRSKF